MEDEGSCLITFEGLTPAEANLAALDLQALLQRTDTVRAEIRRSNPDAQDGGSTLVLLFGAPAVVAIAHGIRAFLAKRASRIQIRTTKGEVIATGDAASNIDVARVVAALQRKG